MSKKKTLDELLKEFRTVHNNKYDYSKVIYVNTNTKVCIICPEHGEFWQTPLKHLSGQGCPKCVRNCKRTTDEFIIKANEIHNNEYNYSKIEYTNNTTKVCIICKEHGEFWQTPHNHLKGQGCPKCGKGKVSCNKIISFDEFVERANDVHNNEYKYIKSTYKKISEKMSIICSIHGEFKQTPYCHLKGQGCPKCGYKKIWNKRERLSNNEFILKCQKIHSNKYSYENTNFKGMRLPIEIMCKEHGIFQRMACAHLRGDGCPKCTHKVSLPERNLSDFINQISKLEIVSNSRKILNSQKELDIYLPKYKLGVEYNGLIWHSEQFKTDKNYHLNKLNECNSQGINLIQIFEDEYLEHKDIVLNKIKHLLKCDNDKQKIQARKCGVREIDKETAKLFLEKNHIQGFVLSTIYIGCYYNDELIGVMSFKEERKGNNKWELNRFATDINYRCIGVGGKLFKYFIKIYNPEYIKSFADRRWTLDKDNNLYVRLGFKLGEVLKPDYRYVNGLKREHKFGYRKQVLIKKYPDKGLTMDMTEKEMCDKLGFYRIWDCGLFKFEWCK